MINNIQALRAFAALNVVLFHALDMSNSYGYNFELFRILRGWGQNGVDIFFVISGFIMVYIQSHNQKSALGFLENRIKRIVPLYWSLTAIFVLLLYFIPSVFRQASFDVQHSVTSFVFISRLFDFHYPVVLQGWTLEFEMLFYMIFGLSILLKRMDTALIASSILLALMFAGDLSAIMCEFVLGMLVAKAYLKGVLKDYGIALFLIGSVGLLATIFYQPDFYNKNLELGFVRVILWGFPSTLLVLSCCYLPQTQKRVLLFLGAASYSIYLVHTMTLSASFKVAKLAGLTTKSSDVIIVLCVVFSALIGSTLYYFYEKPLGRLLANSSFGNTPSTDAAVSGQALVRKI